MRITGQLIDAATGAHLWADRFDGELADVFDLQDRVTASVVGAIAPRLEQAEIERAQRKPTESLDAYDHFLRGMAGIHGWTREANAEAFACFNRAIELDPELRGGLRHGGALLLAAQGERLGRGPGQGRRRGRRLARRAAELGTDDAIALGGAAMVLSYVVGDLDTARGLIARALALDPNYAWGWLVSAWIAGWWGEPEAAIEHAARAMRLSPADPHAFTMRTATASAHFFAGRYGEALAWAEEVAWERPGFLIANAVVAAAAALADRRRRPGGPWTGCARSSRACGWVTCATTGRSTGRRTSRAGRAPSHGEAGQRSARAGHRHPRRAPSRRRCRSVRHP